MAPARWINCAFDRRVTLRPKASSIRPYNLHQAEGAYIFRDIQSKELRDDEYVTHLVTSRERKYVLVMSANRVLYLERGEVLQSHFTSEWMYSWDNFLAPPSMSDKGIMFPVVEPQEMGLTGILHLERKDKPRYVSVWVWLNWVFYSKFKSSVTVISS